ncbi:hypothetical protein PoB_003957900 [Plakobranchus ocellatus]|uniref:Secreted protein n=1 Tax=Plakobranchus ocellatus TaxID=259542 RepID=A0AAV4B352_9GAST|nr:hypothetical protein PoB_003957900 [Plakobranchus ocellatus]
MTDCLALLTKWSVMTDCLALLTKWSSNENSNEKNELRMSSVPCSMTNFFNASSADLTSAAVVEAVSSSSSSLSDLSSLRSAAIS